MQTTLDADASASHAQEIFHDNKIRKKGNEERVCLIFSKGMEMERRRLWRNKCPEDRKMVDPMQLSRLQLWPR